MGSMSWYLCRSWSPSFVSVRCGINETPDARMPSAYGIGLENVARKNVSVMYHSV
jgi:hypothetical protein